MRRCALVAGLVLLAFPRGSVAAPTIRAPAAFLLERDTGQVIYSRRGHERRLIASTTKLMTALVTLERSRLDRTVSLAPYAAGPGESTAGLRAGQRISVRDLLRAMLLASANEAAHSLAVNVAGSVAAFVRSMNAHARALHLRDTHYSTPVGLDTPGNYSSAADLAHLTDVLLANPFFAQTVDRSGASLPSAGNIGVKNRNDLVGRYRFVVGVKTGHTGAAGECLVGAGRRRGATVISVVLGEPSQAVRDADTLSLLRYGLSLYRRTLLVRARRVYGTVRTAAGPPLKLLAARSASAVTRVSAGVRLRVVGVPAVITGSRARGARIGWLQAIVAHRVVAKVALVSARSVPQPKPAPTPAPAPAQPISAPTPAPSP